MSPATTSAAGQTRKHLLREELALSLPPDLKPQGNQPPAKRTKYEEYKQEQVEPLPSFNRENSLPPATHTTARLELASAEYDKTTKAIARVEEELRGMKGKKEALNEEIARLRLETKVKARRDAVLDIDEWEVEYLATSHSGHRVLRLKSRQWLEFGVWPLPAVVGQMKSVLFEALTEIDDQHLLVLLERMEKYWK